MRTRHRRPVCGRDGNATGCRVTVVITACSHLPGCAGGGATSRTPVHLAVYDTPADGETGHTTAPRPGRVRDPHRRPGPREPVVSLGGPRIGPDRALGGLCPGRERQEPLSRGDPQSSGSMAGSSPSRRTWPGRPVGSPPGGRPSGPACPGRRRCPGSPVSWAYTAGRAAGRGHARQGVRRVAGMHGRACGGSRASSWSAPPSNRPAPPTGGPSCSPRPRPAGRPWHGSPWSRGPRRPARGGPGDAGFAETVRVPEWPSAARDEVARPVTEP